MSHLKRLKAPRAWPLIQKKGIKFIAKPMPGPHRVADSITINVVLKDILRYAKTTKDSKRILNKGGVLVNNVRIKSHLSAVGVLDSISIAKLNEHYRLLYNKKGKFYLEKISKEEAEQKLVKVSNKTILKKGRIQLNFHDGTNLIAEKNLYRTKDTLILENNKVKQHLKFEKGSLIYLTGGKYKGKTGTLEIIEESSAITKGRITLRSGKEKITTKKDFAFIIDKQFAK